MAGLERQRKLLEKQRQELLEEQLQFAEKRHAWEEQPNADISF
jgi:hypothetical protein